MDAGTRAALLAALAWQVELGADEAIGETPVDRFAEAAAPAPARAAPPAPPPAALPAAPPAGAAPVAAAPAARRPPAAPRPAPADPGGSPALASARGLAAACATLDELARALAGFEGSPLRAGARSCVFADGNPAARVMVIGEAPGRDEDLAGKPFVGKSGRLLDRMLAAIGLDRAAADPAKAAYITNMIPWRPVDNRTPGGDEIALFLPFVIRHVELAKPDFLLLAGATPAKGLLGTETGITRLRGRWARPPGLSVPALPTLHPAYLLRSPASKRFAWRDLLSLRAALDGEPVAFG